MLNDYSSVSQKDRNEYLDIILYQVLRKLTVGAYIVYLFLGISHIFVLEAEDAVVMVPIAVTTSIFMAVSSKLLKGENISKDKSPFFSLVVLLFLLLNSFLQINTTGKIAESTNVIIIVIGISMIQYRSGWFSFSLIVTILGWLFVSFEWIGDPLWVHYAFGLSISSALSIIFHITIKGFLIKLRQEELNWIEKAAQANSALSEANHTKKILQRLTEASIEGIAFHNGKIILDCNEQLSEMYGYNSREELIGINISSLIQPRELLKVSFFITDTAAHVYETVGLKKDGTTFPVEIRGKTIVNEENDIYRVVIMRDLSTQKLVQKKLRESEANYRLLAENSHDIIYRYSETKGLLYISPSGYRVTGYRFPEMIENNFFTDFFKTGKNRDFKNTPDKSDTRIHKFIRKDGKAIWLETVIQEKVVGNEKEIFGISRDISNRLKDEQFLNAQYNVARLISSNTEGREFLVNILQIICNDLDWVLGELWYPNQENDEALYREAVWSIKDKNLVKFIEDSKKTTFRKGEGLPGIVWSTEQPHLMGNVVTDELFVRSKMAEKAGIHGALSVPVYDGENIYCFMVLFSQNVLEEDKVLLNMLYSIGGQIGQVMKRREAEKELSKSESLFRTMSKFSPIGIFVTDPEGKCIYTNKRYQEITGLSFEATLGDGWGSAFQNEGSVNVLSEWYKTVRENKNYEGLHKIIIGNGIRWVKIYGAAIMDHDEIIGHVGTVEDITEFRDQEEKLIEYSENLGQMVEERTRELELLQQELLQRQRDQQELQLAAEVQNSLLPDEAPTLQGFSVFSKAFPARYVSGDFYDFYKTSSENLQIIIADIAGKGIPAALLTASARAFLRSELLISSSPNLSLSLLNQMMFDDLSNAEKFITMQISQINRYTGKVTYSSAGHTEALVFQYKSGTIIRKSPTTIPLGIEKELGTELNEFYLCPGDLLLLYSDGVTEAENDEEQFFGIERLEEVLLKSCKKNYSADSVVDAINNGIHDFVLSRSQSDDITIIAVKAEPRTFSTEKKGIIRNLDALVGWIMEKCEAYSDDIKSQIELAVSELITNIIKHSYRGKDPSDIGKIRIVLDLEIEEIVIHFFDSGGIFDYHRISMPDFSRANEGGYGLWVIKEIMDDVTYIPGSGMTENQWVLKKSVS